MTKSRRHTATETHHHKLRVCRVILPFGALRVQHEVHQAQAVFGLLVLFVLGLRLQPWNCLFKGVHGLIVLKGDGDLRSFVEDCLSFSSPRRALYESSRESKKCWTHGRLFIHSEPWGKWQPVRPRLELPSETGETRRSNLQTGPMER